MSTSKSPAFQFYAQDWLSDFKVRCLTYEQKGIYIELLAMSWIEPLTSDLDRLAIAMQLQPDSIAMIIDQFFYKEGDFFYNKKLEKYRAEKIKFIKDKKRAGKEGANKRWNKTKIEVKQTHSTPIADPMANDSSSTSTSTSTSTLSNNNRGVVLKNLIKWLESMEDVSYPEKLADKYLKLYSDDIIKRALSNSCCTSRSKFTEICDHYVKEQTK